MNVLKRGALIVLEGVDKCGKSTQSKKLVESLRSKGYKSELMVFPDRTTHTGRLISEYLRDLSNESCKLNDHTIHLLFAANRWENVEKLTRMLQEGITVIVDRYSYSGIAFSAAKNMDPEWCKQPENGLPKPDVVFLLKISQEAMIQRPDFGQERYENKEMQQKVANFYETLIDSNWSVIDADDDVQSIQNQLVNSTIRVIKNVESSAVKSLLF